VKDGQLSLVAESKRAFEFHAFEEESYASGFKFIAGLDEVGRGPLAGPVVAAAVVLPRGFSDPEIRDSKLLSETRREKLAPLIKQNAVCWGLGVVEVEEIDRLNIHQASLLAMVKALATLTSRADCALIDGNQTIPLTLFRVAKYSGGRTLFQKTIIRGDRLCISIAAASIIAKVARDSIMHELDKQYPEYGFAGHKGYSCAAHFRALRRFGPSPVHRQSFRPVREASPQQKTHGPLFER
jgi:ribonuclease HII